MILSWWKKLERRRKLAAGILFLCALGAALGLHLFVPDAPTALRGYEEERVRLFQADIAVEGDGAIMVSERIEVLSAGKRLRRGVVRTLPLKAQGFGGERFVSYELLGVALNGVEITPPAPIPSTDWWQLFVGQEQIELEPGQHAFDVRYRTRGLFAQSDINEGFSSTTGVWPSILVHAVVSVRLPKFIEPESIKARVWLERVAMGEGSGTPVVVSGPKAQPSVTVQPGDSVEGPLVVIVAPRPLSAGEYISYEIVWPPGFVKQTRGTVSLASQEAVQGTPGPVESSPVE